MPSPDVQFPHSDRLPWIGRRVEDWRAPLDNALARRHHACPSILTVLLHSIASIQNAHPSLLISSTDKIPRRRAALLVPACESHTGRHSHSSPPIVWWEADRTSAPVARPPQAIAPDLCALSHNFPRHCCPPSYPRTATCPPPLLPSTTSAPSHLSTATLIAVFPSSHCP